VGAIVGGVLGGVAGVLLLTCLIRANKGLISSASGAPGSTPAMPSAMAAEQGLVKPPAPPPLELRGVYPNTAVYVSRMSPEDQKVLARIGFPNSGQQ